MRGYPSGFTRLLIGTAVVLLVSGVLLVPSMLDLRLEIDVSWRLGAEARLVTVAVHAFVAFFMLVLLGGLWSIHIRAGWRKKRHRVSGCLLASSFGGMAVTGVGIYYLGQEGLSLAASVLHVAFAGLGSAVFTWHGIRGHLAARGHHAPYQPAQTAVESAE